MTTHQISQLVVRSFCSQFVIWTNRTVYGIVSRCKEVRYGQHTGRVLVREYKEQSKESNRAIKELIKLMGRNRDRLHDSMTAEQQETLEKYDDCVNEMYGLIELEIFSYAFRLGGRLMLATLMDSGEDA